MMLALAAILLSYVIPVAAVWRTRISTDIWATGSWADIASIVAGPWLGVAVVAAAMISTFGTFNSLVMSYSRLPVAMAEDGTLPRGSPRKLRNGPPWGAIRALGLARGPSLGLAFAKSVSSTLLL